MQYFFVVVAVKFHLVGQLTRLGGVPGAGSPTHLLLSKSDGDPVYLSMGWRFLRKTESWERRSLNGTINATWKMIGGRRRRAVEG